MTKVDFGGLKQKLSGRPVSYEGLYELVRRTIAAIRTSSRPPVEPAAIRDVNRLVAELLRADRFRPRAERETAA